MTARQAAINDIKESLKRESRCFIQFIKELNPIMNKLVSQQLAEQKHLKKK